MTLHSMMSTGKTGQRAAALGLVLMLLGGCGENGTSPSSESPPTGTPPGDAPATVPTDTTITPIDSTSGDTVGVTSLSGATQVGIVFGTINMPAAYLSTIHTGLTDGGGLTPTNIIPLLAAAKAKNARVILKLCMGRDMFVKNSDGTFSLTKWKALVDRFKNSSLTSYIEDGTLLGHYLIDEPSRTVRWGGKIISQATLEEMARYSKLIWPKLATFARVKPSWLASAPITYTYLDAGWLQYAYGKGDPAALVKTEVAAARSKKLGLMVGLNVLAGGNGSSGLHYWSPTTSAMTASELRSYGNALLDQDYVCGFYMWTHNVAYYGRSDIKAAMTELSNKARIHLKSSCRQF